MKPPRHPQTKGKAKTGFTLIELLVVLVLVGILAALIMSGLSWSQRTAEGAKCVATLRAISGGLMSYTAENGWNLQNFGHIDSGDTNNPRFGKGEFSRVVQVEQPAKTIIIGDSQDQIAPGMDF